MNLYLTECATAKTPTELFRCSLMIDEYLVGLGQI
jgi:hypothetical protein